MATHNQTQNPMERGRPANTNNRAALWTALAVVAIVLMIYAVYAAYRNPGDYGTGADQRVYDSGNAVTGTVDRRDTVNSPTNP